MLKKIIVTILLILAVFLVVASQQPDDFSVTRTAVLDATPGKIFQHVNNLHAWEEWSPWAKMDPNSKIEYAGPQAGKGASMKWSGNWQVGQGAMTIVESKPNSSIKFRLDFEKPMKGTNDAEFTFKPQAGGKTEITWSTNGKNNFAGKAMGLLFNCKKMMSDQFDEGLANLNTVVSGKGK